jgi:hypothetical protein
MKSLKLDENGDISFNSFGRLNFVSDTDLLIQSLQLRLKTIKGELFYNEEYGLEKFKGKINEEILLDILNDVLLQDEKVSSVELTSYNITEVGKISADILITLNTDESLDFNITI